MRSIYSIAEGLYEIHSSGGYGVRIQANTEQEAEDIVDKINAEISETVINLADHYGVELVHHKVWKITEW